MMYGREKSDSAIVAGKPTNKAVSTAAEPVEGRAEAKGNASQQRTSRTQSRVSVSQVLGRIRQPGTKTLCRHTPEVGAICPNSARTDLCGGRSVMSVSTAILEREPHDREIVFQCRATTSVDELLVRQSRSERAAARLPSSGLHRIHAFGGASSRPRNSAATYSATSPVACRASPVSVVFHLGTQVALNTAPAEATARCLARTAASPPRWHVPKETARSRDKRYPIARRAQPSGSRRC